MIRKPAVAGTWYPGTPSALQDAIDRHLAAVDADTKRGSGALVALVAPHAGLMYSGPVAAHAYRLLRDRTFDTVVLVGPSHFVGFDGVAAFPDGAFDTPLGPAAVDAGMVDDLARATPVIHKTPAPHQREHSLEMQLPFVRRVLPGAKIVPLLVGFQTAATAMALGEAMGRVLSDRRALLVASTDLSHYHDADTATRLDRIVVDAVERFDADGLQRALDSRPEHACGGGPTVAVMRAAKRLGARQALILDYADSGDVSGDKQSVVGYMAAALGTFDDQ
jgi:AmmeMemoRadiSam system protein B